MPARPRPGGPVYDLNSRRAVRSSSRSPKRTHSSRQDVRGLEPCRPAGLAASNLIPPIFPVRLLAPSQRDSCFVGAASVAISSSRLPCLDHRPLPRSGRPLRGFPLLFQPPPGHPGHDDRPGSPPGVHAEDRGGHWGAGRGRPPARGRLLHRRPAPRRARALG